MSSNTSVPYSRSLREHVRGQQSTERLRTPWSIQTGTVFKVETNRSYDTRRERQRQTERVRQADIETDRQTDKIARGKKQERE